MGLKTWTNQTISENIRKLKEEFKDFQARLDKLEDFLRPWISYSDMQYINQSFFSKCIINQSFINFFLLL